MTVTVLFRDPVSQQGLQDSFSNTQDAIDYIMAQLNLWRLGKNVFPTAGWQMQITVGP